MAVPVIMPRQGQSVESCIITKWHKKKGERVAPGEILFTYETDKASFDEEAKVAGVLLDVYYTEGDDVSVLMNVCVIGEEGEAVAGQMPSKGGEPDTAAAAATSAAVPAPVSAPAPAPAPVAASAAISTAAPASTQVSIQDPEAQNAGNAPGISPRAKNLAIKSGVDISGIQGTGPNGRIIEKDIINAANEGKLITKSAAAADVGTGAHAVEGSGLGGRITVSDISGGASGVAAGVASGAAAAGSGQGAVAAVAAVASTAAGMAAGMAAKQETAYEEVKLTNIRKVIAKAMQASLSTTAQLTLDSSFDASRMMDMRRKFKQDGSGYGLDGITINDMILYAISRVLGRPAHKSLNAHLVDDRMLYFKKVHLGIAVDTERGLMVPVLSDADTRTLPQISSEVRKLVQDCQKGTINPDLLKGGTFTTTNLGTLGIESFTPVLNPPQTGILGINKIIEKPRTGPDGKLELYPSMGLSLTFDHRALDGAPAARFLKDVCDALEKFDLLLASC